MEQLSLSKNLELAAIARKQRYAGLRGKCCGTRVRGSVPQPQSSSLALPCQILVSVDGCQSLTAFGSCIHWMPAPSRRPKTPAGGSASCTSTFSALSYLRYSTSLRLGPVDSMRTGVSISFSMNSTYLRQFSGS